MPPFTSVTPRRCATWATGSRPSPAPAPTTVRSALLPWLREWRSSSREKASEAGTEPPRGRAPHALGRASRGPYLACLGSHGTALATGSRRGSGADRSGTRAAQVALRPTSCRGSCCTWQSTVERADRWSEAEAAFYAAIDLARRADRRPEVTMSLARLAWLEARQGKQDRCRAHAAEALELSRRLGLATSEVWALNALGDLELGQGRPEEALIRYEEQVAAVTSAGHQRHRSVARPRTR